MEIPVRILEMKQLAFEIYKRNRELTKEERALLKSVGVFKRQRNLLHWASWQFVMAVNVLSNPGVSQKTIEVGSAVKEGESPTTPLIE